MSDQVISYVESEKGLIEVTLEIDKKQKMGKIKKGKLKMKKSHRFLKTNPKKVKKREGRK